MTPDEYDRLSGVRRTDDPEERIKRMCIHPGLIPAARGPQCIPFDSEDAS